jgi:hypothetical protein
MGRTCSTEGRNSNFMPDFVGIHTIIWVTLWMERPWRIKSERQDLAMWAGFDFLRKVLIVVRLSDNEVFCEHFKAQLQELSQCVLRQSGHHYQDTRIHECLTSWC